MKADPNKRMLDQIGPSPAPFGLTWGICRSNPLHLYCANEEAMMLTWMAFHSQNDIRGESAICVGCGGPVNEIPLEGFDPICPDFA